MFINYNSFSHCNFNYYLQTIEKGYSQDMGFQIVKLIVHFVHLIHDYGRKDLLDSYVKVKFALKNFKPKNA